MEEPIWNIIPPGSGTGDQLEPQTMLDGDIRKALVERLNREDPSAAIFHELPLLRGKGRADIAAVNGVLAGYEIKSERDTLRRIVAQRNHYDSVFDVVVIVVARL